ncbi:MAG: hypothetical protein R6T87_09995, partial [Marinobacter sp.]
MNSLKSLAGLQPVRCRWVAAVVMPVAFMAAAYGQSAGTEAPVFEFEQRSTIDTIRFRSIEEEALANTAIEGGLEAPAAGVLVQSARDDDVYLDPLALQPHDSRTDLGRSEIPVEFRFSN